MSLLKQNQFRHRPFAWFPLGKVAYLLTALFRASANHRDASGNIDMFYAAHCMEDYKRIYQADWDFHGTTGAAARSKSTAFIVELLNYFNIRWVASTAASDVTESWRDTEGWTVHRAFIVNLFRRAAPFRPSDGGKRVGFYPVCSPPLLLANDIQTIFKPTGWEAVKCVAIKTTVALFNPIDFYRGNKCLVWKTVIATGIEAVNAAIWIALLSNPGTGIATIVLRGSGQLATGNVFRLLVKYIWVMVQQKASKNLQKVLRMDLVANAISGTMLKVAPTIVWLLVNFGFNVGQKEHSVLADPMWIDCLTDYIKFALVALVNVLLTFAGDPLTIVLQFIKIILFKAVGCQPDTSVWSFGTVRHMCSPWNKAKYDHSSASKDYDRELRKLSQALYTSYKAGDAAPEAPGFDFVMAPESEGGGDGEGGARASVSDASGCLTDMQRLEQTARDNVRPDMCACGLSYQHVQLYLEASGGYGGFPPRGARSSKCGVATPSASGLGFACIVPASFSGHPAQFAEYMNTGSNAEHAGLQRLDLSNPYDAPLGAIVVVGGGSPGTKHPTAGDISVKGSGDTFWNDGAMNYGGRSLWTHATTLPTPFEYGQAGKAVLLGVYVPRVCSQQVQVEGSGSVQQASFSGSAAAAAAGMQAEARQSCPSDATVEVTVGASTAQWSTLPVTAKLVGAGPGNMLNGQPQYESDSLLLRYDGEKYGIVSKADGSPLAVSPSVFLPVGNTPWGVRSMSTPNSRGGRYRRQDYNGDYDYGDYSDDDVTDDSSGGTPTPPSPSPPPPSTPPPPPSCAGECINVNSHTCNGAAIQTGLCTGANHIKCCPRPGTKALKTTPPSPPPPTPPSCPGECINTNTHSCNGAATLSNKCPGGANVRCCPHPGTKAMNTRPPSPPSTTPQPATCGGECADINKFDCKGASFQRGLCPGSNSNLCCPTVVVFKSSPPST